MNTESMCNLIKYQYKVVSQPMRERVSIFCVPVFLFRKINQFIEKQLYKIDTTALVKNIVNE